MRGFWIDQRIESGVWSKNRFPWQPIISHFRRLERQALKISSGIVVLTRDARDVIAAHPNFGGGQLEVIPCSVDLKIFMPCRNHRILQRARLGLSADDLVLAYLGSAGPLYRIDALYNLATQLQARGVPARILFVGEHSTDDHVSRALAHGLTLNASDIRCCKVPHHEVPKILSAADFGVSFILPGFSSLGVSATKVGEYLACGLPVISSKGIGDIDRIIENGKSGLVLSNFDEMEIGRAADMISAGGFSTPGQIRYRAKKFFDMEQAISLYDSLYRNLGKKDASTGNRPSA